MNIFFPKFSSFVLSGVSIIRNYYLSSLYPEKKKKQRQLTSFEKNNFVTFVGRKRETIVTIVESNKNKLSIT